METFFLQILLKCDIRVSSQYKRFRNGFTLSQIFFFPFFLNLERRKNITSKNGPKNQTIAHWCHDHEKYLS